MIQLIFNENSSTLHLVKGCPLDWNDNGYFDQYDQGYIDSIIDDATDIDGEFGLDDYQEIMDEYQDMIDEWGQEIADDWFEGYVDGIEQMFNDEFDAEMQEWFDETFGDIQDDFEPIDPSDIPDIEDPDDDPDGY